MIAPTGTPAQLLGRWLEGEFDLVASEELLSELARVLRYPRIASRLDPGRADDFLRLLRDEAVVSAKPKPRQARITTVDPDDQYLVDLAAAERALLVSGDRHLTELAPDIPVYTPAAFATTLDEHEARRSERGDSPGS